MSNPKHEDIENLAHALWEARGRPSGSPETDWFEAERLLSQSEVNVQRHWLEKKPLSSTAAMRDEQFNDEDTAPEEVTGAVDPVSIDPDAELENAASTDSRIL
jgi:hypothetical protein